MRIRPFHFCTVTLLTLLFLFSASAQTPNSAVGHYRDGASKVGKGDLDGAIEDYSRAIAISSRLGPAVTTDSDAAKIKVIDPFTANA